MQCEEVRDQLTDYLTERLAESDRTAIQEHLISCDNCRDEAVGLKDIWHKLEAIPAEKPDSPAMRARFEVMLEAYRHGMDHAPATPWWTSLNQFIGTWWPKQPALQFGLTAALLLIGVVAGRQYAPAVDPSATVNPSQSTELVQMRSDIQTMRQMVAVSLMQQQSANERLKGVNAIDQIDQPDAALLTTVLDVLMHDPNVNVRLAVVDALKRFNQQSVKADVLKALAKQDSPLVQAELIDYVVEMKMKEKDSLDMLRQISLDTTVNESVRKRAEWGLEHLQ